MAGSGVFDGSGDLSIAGIAEVFFNGETRPIAAKAGITVNTYAGYLTLTAAKQLAGTPVIKTITLSEKNMTLSAEQLLDFSLSTRHFFF